jgi:hypothetical protein
MIVAFKNFKRNRMVNLTATSIRHFLPDIKIYCITLYKQNYDTEYANQEPLHDYIEEIMAPTKYISPIDVHDSTQYGATSGFANPCNGMYFCEGYNLIYSMFEGINEPVLILGEDHYFTKKTSLEEMLSTVGAWDVCYGDWDSWPGHPRANGSILCIVPSKVSHIFPIPEVMGSIEDQVGEFILKNIPGDRLHRLSTREALNYHGDGRYTNSSEEMILDLKAAGIL